MFIGDLNRKFNLGKIGKLYPTATNFDQMANMQNNLKHDLSCKQALNINFNASKIDYVRPV